MSYLVLARKYRPQTFADVVGQEHVTRTLGNAFAQDRVHHAFLFCGPRGCGKTTTARILGKALNCERGASATPCGVCSACESIANGSSVDYFEMDGASNRGIDSIRELTDALRYQPAALRRKVYVIDEVHMLTTEAFNALLKSLEEPPPHVSFVLATTEPHKIPNTILSRCQRYDFKLVPGTRLAEHLANVFASEALPIDGAAVALLVRESGGSVRDALSLADQVISFAGDGAITEAAVAEVLGVADRALTSRLVDALAAGDAKSALEGVDAAAARGVDEVQIARALVRYLRDLAVTQVVPGAGTLVEGGEDERGELERRAGTLDRSRVKQMFERMLRACEDLADSAQPRLVLDLAIIDLATREPVVPIGDLLQRLGELEARLARGAEPSGGSRGGASGGSRGGLPSPGEAASSSEGSHLRADEASASFAAAAKALGRVDREEPSDRPPSRLPAEPSAAEPSAAEPSAAEPSAAEPSAAKPSAAKPSAAEPSAAKPSAAKPSAAKQSAAEQSAAGERSAGEPPIEEPPGSPGEKPPGAPVEEPPGSPGEKPTSPVEEPPDAPLEVPPNAPIEEPPNAPVEEPPNAPVEEPPNAPVEVPPEAPVEEPPEAPLEVPPPGDPPRIRAAAAGFSFADPMRAWEAVIVALDEAKEISLLTVYQSAKVLAWTEEGLSIGFSAEGITSEMAAHPERVAALSRFVERLVGRPVPVALRLLSPDEVESARSLAEEADERRNQARERHRQEAHQHPAVRAVLETFGATIKEIKTHV